MSLKFNEKVHRYWLDGKPVTGATTLIGGGIPKPALVNWAAKQVAEFVDANPEEVARLRDTPDLVRSLAAVPQQKKETAGLRGTQIHDLGERYLAGEDIGEAMAHHEAEVMGLVEFIEDLDLQPLVVEKSLANRAHWYAGRVDFIGTSKRLHGGRPVLIDWKTSRGVYGETALQTAAYARAEFWVDDEDPDTEHPLPEVVATYVAHIQASGTTLYPLATSRKQIDEHFRDFQAAMYTAKRAKARKAFIGDPVWTPQTRGEAA